MDEIRYFRSSTGRVATVELVGDHDIGTSDDLRAVLDDLADVDTVVVDLVACTFVDSTVIGAIVAGYKRRTKTGRQLVLTNAGGSVARTLELLHVDQLVPLFALPEQPAAPSPAPAPTPAALG